MTEADASSSRPLPGFLDLMAADPAYSACPEARLADLRARCPVHADPVTGHVLLARHADARRLLNDPHLWRHPSRAAPESLFYRFTELRPVDPTVPAGERTSILMLDQPDHLRIRAPLQKAFHARVFRARPLVEDVVERVLSGLADRHAFDLVSELAVPVPIHAIARILGVAPERQEEFRQWSESIILTLNPLRSAEQDAEALAATDALHAHLAELMALRRRAPADDLVTDMVQAQAKGAPLSDREIMINLTALLVGGNLTTTDLIASGVKLLLEHQEELARLKADPALATAAVEETLRMEGPIDFTVRIAPAPMTIAGVPVAARQPIFALLRAANRDPEVFPDPDQFRLDRHVAGAAPHVAFGGGAHSCIGAALARLEGRIVFQKLFAVFPDLRLEESAPVYRSLPGFRGLARLPVLTRPE
ncbi:cytochrome P450 [Thermaurantiacus sp.]